MLNQISIEKGVLCNRYFFSFLIFFYLQSGFTQATRRPDCPNLCTQIIKGPDCTPTKICYECGGTMHTVTGELNFGGEFRGKMAWSRGINCIESDDNNDVTINAEFFVYVPCESLEKIDSLTDQAISHDPSLEYHPVDFYAKVFKNGNELVLDAAAINYNVMNLDNTEESQIVETDFFAFCDTLNNIKCAAKVFVQLTFNNSPSGGFLFFRQINKYHLAFRIIDSYNSIQHINSTSVSNHVIHPASRPPVNSSSQLNFYRNLKSNGTHDGDHISILTIPICNSSSFTPEVPAQVQWTQVEQRNEMRNNAKKYRVKKRKITSKTYPSQNIRN